ncbi:unnamed protein product [Ceutorhynchus assimilis]|uniref:RING-CH-type domain-containing protein n=1 Tax=Ceutorhynchus assimilis TaxID=467358 RepID=A0A9N9MWS1_9CUCU|nr:unnamed protein product [Ceutorhynchus assimilis]
MYHQSNILTKKMSDKLSCSKSNNDLANVPKSNPKVSEALEIHPIHVVPSNLFPSCRICQTNTPNERLISPCNCKGTLAFIHLSCLERWLNQSGRNFCELCNFRYEAIETQRYGLCESLRLWICHPRHRHHIRSDFVIAILLSLVTSGLLFVCIYGMDYFALQAERLGLEQNWIRFSLATFLAIISLGYIVSIFLLLRDHLVPWYAWWVRTVNIRLQIPHRRDNNIRPEII